MSESLQAVVPLAAAEGAGGKAAGDRAKIGLIAGWGDYPLVVASELKRQGHEVYCQGGIQHADPKLAEICDHFVWLGLTRLGGAIRYFKRHGVRTAMLVGKYHKTVIMQPGFLIKHLPDVRCMRAFFSSWILGQKDRRDDTILGIIVSEFARDGIRIVPPTDFLPELLVKHGCLTRRTASAAQLKDIELGWRLAKELGRLDIGQTVAVKGRAPLAIEAIEGTDECIRRAGQLCPAGGFTVVKVAKPQQDMRFDVPTIGRGTLETLVKAGGSVLAIEAGKTIIVNEPEVVEFANRHNLVMLAVQETQAELVVPESRAQAA
jgi:hypothetical protein